MCRQDRRIAEKGPTPVQDMIRDMVGPSRSDPGLAAADTLQERVAAWLRHAIVTGRFSPGERLVQADIAEHLKVSLTPVREAMRDLAAEGLLTLSPRRGVVVRVLTRAEVQELRMLCAILERTCGELIAQRITPDELAHAHRLDQTMWSLSSLEDYFALNTQFHRFLYETARSPELTAILRRIHDATMPYLPATFVRSQLRHRDGLEEHRRFLAACAQRDAEAAGDIMMQHFDMLFEQIEQIIAEPTSDAP
jgi:DNA-binding GntR family transcriptional regulator